MGYQQRRSAAYFSFLFFFVYPKFVCLDATVDEFGAGRDREEEIEESRL